MGKGQSIAGLVLGIIALIFALMGATVVTAWLSLPMAIIGLVLAVVGGKKLRANGEPAGVATAALVVGIIAVVFSAVAFLTCGVCGACATCTACGTANAYDSLANELANELAGYNYY